MVRGKEGTLPGKKQSVGGMFAEWRKGGTHKVLNKKKTIPMTQKAQERLKKTQSPGEKRIPYS